jgi:mRNA-capping enzyme
MNVPPRWLHCPRKSKIVAKRFLAFKTPLSDQYKVPDESLFSTAMLVLYYSKPPEKLGLVIDLTKTDRFYDSREITKAEIGYYKLQCEGYGEAPTKEQVNVFIQVCKSFFNKNPFGLIGVHCTHGFNRTGFLIACYLIEEENWSCEYAVKAFRDARPPGIYKEEYLAELAERYNDKEREGLETPEKPDWYFMDDNATDEVDDDGLPVDAKGKGKKRRKERTFDQAKTFAIESSDVSIVPSPLRETVQQICQRACGWEGAGFPGSQPVSMDVSNLCLLGQMPYRVSWKADGTRYLMLIRNESEVYMVDRDNAVFRINKVVFPTLQDQNERLKDTLVDGELVLDKVDKRGNIRPRYLIYDIIMLKEWKDIARRNHSERMECINVEIIKPRELLARANKLNTSLEPFGIRSKQFWDMSEAQMVLEKYAPSLTHETDGLIFSPERQTYIPGQCRELLKWKPPELNSVDFQLKISRIARPGQLPETVGELYVMRFTHRFSAISLKGEGGRELKEHDGKIIECCWDFKKGQWKFLRVRTDKSYPNAYETAQSVCNSIKNPVTKKMVLDLCDRRNQIQGGVAVAERKRPPLNGTERDSELMPPPGKRLQSRPNVD